MSLPYNYALWSHIWTDSLSPTRHMIEIYFFDPCIVFSEWKQINANINAHVAFYKNRSDVCENYLEIFPFRGAEARYIIYIYLVATHWVVSVVWNDYHSVTSLIQISTHINYFLTVTIYVRSSGFIYFWKFPCRTFIVYPSYCTLPRSITQPFFLGGSASTCVRVLRPRGS